MYWAFSVTGTVQGTETPTQNKIVTVPAHVVISALQKIRTGWLTREWLDWVVWEVLAEFSESRCIRRDLNDREGARYTKIKDQKEEHSMQRRQPVQKSCGRNELCLPSVWLECNVQLGKWFRVRSERQAGPRSLTAWLARIPFGSHSSPSSRQGWEYVIGGKQSGCSATSLETRA